MGSTNREQIQDETTRVEELQRGLTGRAVGPGAGPRASRIAERIARQQVAAAGEEQAKKEKIQSEQLRLAEEAQEQAFTDQQLGQIEQAMSAKQSLAQQTESILNNLERAGKELDLQKRAAQLEQVGFNLRMNNKQYIDRLNQAAQVARLDDALRFEEELKKAIFEDEIDLINNDLEFRRLLDADARELSRELSQISLDQAMSIASSQIAQESQAAKWNSVSTAVSAGAQAYATYKKNVPDTTPRPKKEET